MKKNLLKEITKLKYLNNYNRSKTLNENRTLLTEELLTGLFARIFTKKLAGEAIQMGMTNATKLTLRNIEKYVADDFAEMFNKKIVAAQQKIGFPTFLPGIQKIGGKVTDINSMLSMLRRVLRDGNTGALNTIERNIMHESIAAVDDDFFKMLEKSANKMDDIKMLRDPKTSNALKREILDDPKSKMRGLSDEFLEKIGIPATTIRKTAKEVAIETGEMWWKGLKKGGKEALAVIGPKVKSILTNGVKRFKSIMGRVKIDWNIFKHIADTFVIITMIPIWIKMTVFKMAIFRMVGGSLRRGLKKMMTKEGGEQAVKTSFKKKMSSKLEPGGNFWDRGLLSDMIQITAKEGTEKGVGVGAKILNIPSLLSTILLGSRSFNYFITGIIWTGYMLSDNIIGEYINKAKNYLFGVLRGETLGPCAPVGLTSVAADIFVPDGDTGMLNKLGVTFESKKIKLDAYELYAALSPQCFTSEDDFTNADEVIKAFLENAPSRLYTSLVAREYRKLTGKPEGQVLPNFKELCRTPLFAKGTLYDDIITFEKHEDWAGNIFSFSMPMERLPLATLAKKICELPMIEKDFDEMLLEVNEYLWDPEGAQVPDFIKEVTEGMSQEDLAAATEEILNQPEVWATIQADLKELEDSLELQGITIDNEGNLELQLKELIRLKIALQNAPGIDQLVYITSDGYFTSRDAGIDPMKMAITTYPAIDNDLVYAIGDVPQEISGAINVNALDKDVLCDEVENVRIGYLCYYAQFRDGDEDYYNWLPDMNIKDMNGVEMKLKDRVDETQAQEIAQENPILWAIAAYTKHNTIAMENPRMYKTHSKYEVLPEFTKKGLEENKRYKIGLGTLLDR